MMNGVSYDIAESWSDDERFCAIVSIGELKGGEFDWRRMRWVDD